MRLYKLQFLSPLHVDSRGTGEPAVAEEMVHSDTLSAALCLSWASIQPETDDFFFLQPPFRVSSAFPYMEDILLFPTPAWRIWKDLDTRHRKRIKSVRWISRLMFQEVLAGREVSVEEVDVLHCGVALFKREVDQKPHLRELRPWVMEERQRVSVDRLGISQEGGLFFFGLQVFAPQCGLYFLADLGSFPQKNFSAALGFLGDSGIGADRNSGLGHFRIASEETFKWNPSAKAQGALTLSLFNPGPADSLEDLTLSAAYGLTTRSGWIFGSTLGRPPIRVFSEGSYFSTRPEGRVVPMLDDTVRKRLGLQIGHSAPRDFRALSLPCVESSYLKEKKT